MLIVKSRGLKTVYFGKTLHFACPKEEEETRCSANRIQNKNGVCGEQRANKLNY